MGVENLKAASEQLRLTPINIDMRRDTGRNLKFGFNLVKYYPLKRILNHIVFSHEVTQQLTLNIFGDNPRKSQTLLADQLSVF